MLIVSLVLSYQNAVAQIHFKKDTSDLTFTGTRINPYQVDYDSTGHFTFSAYLDTYGAYYTDTVGPGGFVKFPTSAPRNGQFGLNILQFSTKYESRFFRGTATVFLGDIPESSWSPKYNLIQEANLGFRIVKKVWLDAGYFRTHIGLESIQPRENMTIGISTTTYFEPYYMSGAKLTYSPSKVWSLQLNAFNGFNSYVENNANKAMGVSVSFTPGKKFTSTFSSLVCDESPDGFNRDQTRVYSNWIGVYKSNRWSVGYEFNYGLQTNSDLNDSTKTAYMFSFILATKYRFTSKWASYARIEHFTDKNEMLTGPIVNENHKLVGLDLNGLTVGFEYKPIPNSYVRIEARLLQTASDEKIFQYKGNSRNQREEILFGIGLWF